MIVKQFMAVQHIAINKKFLYLLFLLVIVVCLGGCQKDIPEGEIKDYVSAFDFDETYENVKYGSSVLNSVHYIDGISQGEITIYTYIDRRDGLYHYSKTVLSGDYYGDGVDQFKYYTRETIAYLNEDGFVVAYELVDGLVNELQYRNEDMDLLIKNFFYTDLEYNYHKGGCYYGDYILGNIGNYYNSFKINEKTNNLEFSVKSQYTDRDKLKYNLIHQYSVNQYGMIVNLFSKTELDENKGSYSLTTMECDYENEFEKIYSFLGENE